MPAAWTATLLLLSLFTATADREYVPAVCVFKTKFGLTDATMPGLVRENLQLQLDVTEYWKDAIWNAPPAAVCPSNTPAFSIHGLWWY